MAPLISVIIPVYNVQEHLPKCLESVLGQTFRNLEVICVDDCSSDASPEILREQAAKDSRLRIISQDSNCGVSASRNKGLAAARGEYVFFLDADDWIDAGHLEAMYSKAIETGRNIIVNESWLKEFPDRSEKPSEKSILNGESGVFPVECVQSRLYQTVWSRFYRRSFIEDNGLRFPEELQYGEDYYFSGLAEVLQEDSYVFAGPPYHYRQRTGSLNHIKHPDAIMACILLYQAWKSRGVDVEGLKLFYAWELEIESERKFVTVRDFFYEIRTLVRAHPGNYVHFDLFCMEALLSCRTYEDFLKRFNPNMVISFVKAQRVRRPSVTVVVPVYNTLSCLPRCMDSVCVQTFSDLEILCIDDGSTDGSGEYLDKMAATDPRIRVIHFANNGGVPAARNRAIDEARGEWVFFMDSDDWIDPDYIEALVLHSRRTGLDVVSNTTYIYEYDDTSKSRYAEVQFLIPGKDAFYDPRIIQRGLLPVVWLRLYRRSFLLGSGVRFPELRGGVEDNYFVGLTELLQEKGYVFHGPAYHYYQREGSLVRTSGNAFRMIQNARLFYDELVSRGIPAKGVSLVFIKPDIAFDTEEEYRFARNFFLDVQDIIRNDESIYPKIVPVFMEVILSCPDLASYNVRCRPNFYVTYIREHRKAVNNK